MERKRYTLPDAANCSVTKNFTQVPNDLIRNPTISGKAKAILCLLLSNKQGWHSYISKIKEYLKEGENALRSGMSELEEHGYLIRFKYRDKATKVWKGSFWAYTDIPGQFNIEYQLLLLDEKGFEVPENPDMENPDLDNPDLDNPGLKILINKNTNNKNTNSYDADADGRITLSQFDEFWKAYPKKVHKGKALTKWKQLCNKPATERPKQRDILVAIRRQKKSEQWQDPTYIPHPSTWLNQSRWLDDPKQMRVYNRDEPGDIGDPVKNLTARLNGVKGYTADKMTRNFREATALTEDIDQHQLSNNLTALYKFISGKRPAKVDEQFIRSPEGLIGEYVDWLGRQDWMDNVSASMFQPQGRMFKRFVREFESDININPITGR